MAPLVAGDDGFEGMDVLPAPYRSTFVRDRAKGERAAGRKPNRCTTRPRHPARQGHAAG